jgi:hypothetical protein
MNGQPKYCLCSRRHRCGARALDSKTRKRAAASENPGRSTQFDNPINFSICAWRSHKASRGNWREGRLAFRQNANIRDKKTRTKTKRISATRACARARHRARDGLRLARSDRARHLPNARARPRGEKRGNQTHESKTDPDAKLYRKSSGSEARLSYLGHTLVENRSGLIVGTYLTQADGYAERDAALLMLYTTPSARRSANAFTLGAPLQVRPDHDHDARHGGRPWFLSKSRPVMAVVVLRSGWRR